MPSEIETLVHLTFTHVTLTHTQTLPSQIIPVAPTFLQVRVVEVSSQLADDLDGFQVAGALQSQDSLHCQLCKVILMMSE